MMELSAKWNGILLFQKNIDIDQKCSFYPVIS